MALSNTSSRFWWPAGLCQELAARGFAIARYDQRDAGESTRIPDTGSSYQFAAIARKRRESSNKRGPWSGLRPALPEPEPQPRTATTTTAPKRSTPRPALPEHCSTTQKTPAHGTQVNLFPTRFACLSERSARSADRPRFPLRQQAVRVSIGQSHREPEDTWPVRPSPYIATSSRCLSSSPVGMPRAQLRHRPAWRPCAPQSVCHRFGAAALWLRAEGAAEVVTKPEVSRRFPPSLPTRPTSSPRRTCLTAISPKMTPGWSRPIL